MFQPAQRIQVDLSGLTVQGVSFSQNVKRVLGTIVRQISPARSRVSVRGLLLGGPLLAD